LTQKCGLMITSEAPKELNDKTHLWRRLVVFCTVVVKIIDMLLIYSWDASVYW
jgi:hypothetical protein